MKKDIKKSDIYGGSTYPDEKIYKQYLDQEERKYKEQEKVPVKAGDKIKVTKPRKNEYGEWNAKVYVNGKVYRPAEIFADSKDDAISQVEEIKRIYKDRVGATIEEEETKKLKVLREEIKTLSGLYEAKSNYQIYHSQYSGAVKEAENFCERQGFFWNKDESFDKIGNGPRRPKEGETNRFSLELFTKEGEPAGKAVHFQIYGMKDRYELNTYLSPLRKNKYEYPRS